MSSLKLVPARYPCPVSKASRRNLHSTQWPRVKVLALLDKPRDFQPGGHDNRFSDLSIRSSLNDLLSRTALPAPQTRLDAEEDLAREGLEEAVDIEGELTRVLEALRHKQEDLERTQRVLEDGRAALSDSRADIARRENALNAEARRQEAGRKEVDELKAAVAKQAQELADLRRVVADKVGEVSAAKESLARKVEEVKMAHAAIREKNERLIKAEAGLKARGKELREAQDELEGARLMAQEAGEMLEAQKRECWSMKQELEEKKKAVAGAERELRRQAEGMMATEVEMGQLRRKVEKLGKTGALVEAELAHLRSLLAEVQGELGASQQTLERSQGEVLRLQGEVAEREKAIDRSRMLLKEREHELEVERRSVGKAREDLQLERGRCLDLQQLLQEELQKKEALETELQGERRRVAGAEEERGEARRALRAAEQSVSDAMLSLQLKDTELVASRLEAQDTRHELLTLQRKARAQEKELLTTQALAETLSKELASAKLQVQLREGSLSALEGSLKLKEDALEALKGELGASLARVADAESVVVQMAELSEQLAQAASWERVPRVPGAEPLLCQANEELFATRRMLLLRELELTRLQNRHAKGAEQNKALKESLAGARAQLVERGEQVRVLREAVQAKEERIRGLLGVWEEREAEIVRMRGELMAGAEELVVWKERVQRGVKEVGQNWDEVGLVSAKLELEVVREEVSAALTAMKGLADLSTQLKAQATADLSIVLTARDYFAQGDSLASTQAHPAGPSHTDEPPTAGAGLLSPPDQPLPSCSRQVAGVEGPVGDAAVLGEAGADEAGEERIEASLYPAISLPLLSPSDSSSSSSSSSGGLEGGLLPEFLIGGGDLVELGLLEKELEGKEEALLLAQRAMEGLSRLTKRLVQEAAFSDDF